MKIVEKVSFFRVEIQMQILSQKILARKHLKVTVENERDFGSEIQSAKIFS